MIYRRFISTFLPSYITNVDLAPVQRSNVYTEIRLFVAKCIKINTSVIRLITKACSWLVGINIAHKNNQTFVTIQIYDIL